VYRLYVSSYYWKYLTEEVIIFFFPIFQLAKAIDLVIDDQIVDPFAWTSIEFPDPFVKLYMSGPRFATLPGPE
jgi:hypothetical protein